MDKFKEIGQLLVAKIRGQLGHVDQADRKKWYAYSGLLVVSFVLFLTLGGSKPRPPVNIPAEDADMLIGETFDEMSDRLVGMGEPDSPGADWEKIPEGLDPVYESWGRDPFESLLPERTTEYSLENSDWTLTAISWKGDEGIVLINDSILKKGDFVDGAKVLEIFMDSVILERGNKQIALTLSGGA